MKHSILLVSLVLFSFIHLFAQNEKPVAVSDTVTVMAEDTTVIHVLQNDYDPDGNSFYVKSVYSPKHGTKDFNDSLVYYQSDYYYGNDSLSYNIKDDGNPPRISYKAYIYVTVLENPNLPIAVNDTFTVLQQKSTPFNLLKNDSDSNGDSLILDTLSREHGSGNFTITSDSICTYKSSDYFMGTTSFLYKIVEKSTSKKYFSNWGRVVVEVLDNPDIPTAVNDTLTATTFITTPINVLKNDIDPLGFPLEVFSVLGSENTTVEIISDSVIAIRTTLFSGTDDVYYRVREKNSPESYVSSWATVKVQPAFNPDAPIAVPDSVTLLFMDSVSVNVLKNDYSPVSQPLEIMDISCGSNYSRIEDSLIYLSNIDAPLSFDDTVHQVVYHYRVREKYHPELFSDWGEIYLTVKRDPDLPAGVADYSSATSGFPIYLDLLQNDYNPQNDSLGYITNDHHNRVVFQSDHSSMVLLDNGLIQYTPYADFSGIDTATYFIGAKGVMDGKKAVSYGYLIVTVENSKFFNVLTANNIQAGVNADGYLFNNYGYTCQDAEHVPARKLIPQFEVPKNSGANAIFSSSIWIGGNDRKDSSASLHLAGVRYMQFGRDFWQGPVADEYNSSYDSRWIRGWKLTKYDIGYHVSHYDKPGYVMKDEIKTWPGNGNVANGEAEQLAPYFDKDGNGIYEPQKGDYPLIRGDQAVFFIFNDDRDFHTETQGKKLGIEVHGMAYAFDQPDDSALYNTVFVHYDIYNHSDTTYYNTYVGIFTDADAGNFRDDYVLSDVQQGAMITYNGDDFDENFVNETGQLIYGYGDKLPAIATTMIGGATMDADGIDNPSGGCDESINGLNFDNGVVDDERWGMQYFGYFNNGGYYSDPSIAPEYYNLLHGYYNNGKHWKYGYLWDSVSPGWEPVDCNYMFPGNSDSCNYGTGGMPPGGGFGQNDSYWTELVNNNGTPDPPGDRRGIVSTGPFTFKPNDKQELDMAYVFARSYDYTNPVDLVKDRITELLNKVKTDSLIILPDEISKINENNALLRQVNIYPNPTPKESVNIDCRGITIDIDYILFSISGVKLSAGKLIPNSINSITLPNTDKGVYIIHLQTANGYYYGKLVRQ